MFVYAMRKNFMGKSVRFEMIIYFTSLFILDGFEKS